MGIQVDPSKIAEGVVKEYERLSGNRTNWEGHWTEVAERVWPAQSKLFQSRGYTKTAGEKRNDKVFDSTASVALNRFGAILDSLLTPRNQTWHRIAASDPYLNKDRSVRLWFEEVNRILFKYRYAPKSNFASQNQQNYKSLGAFGSGCLFVDKLAGRDKGLRYRAIHLGEIFFKENHQGLIDTALRYFPLTARQAMQMWPETCPDEVKSSLEQNPEREFYFIHCVKPREDYDVQRVDALGAEFASYYVSVSGRSLVAEGGYTSFPYAISRYEQVPGEVYGRSPAMDVLPAIKTLNEEKKTVLKQGQRVVDPVLLAHDDGIMDGFSLKPGALNYGGVTADGRPLVHALPSGSVMAGKELMDDERQIINDAFLVTLFQIMVESPTMTATEVMERTREKGILLAPTIGRQQSEYLGPMIERETDLLTAQGLIPPMPMILQEAGAEYKVEYDSPLSRAQRSEEASGLLRTVESALNVAGQTGNPAPLDHFNWDVIIPELADIQGVPEKWMNSMKDIQALRQTRAQQMERQQSNLEAPGAAALIKSAAVAKKAGIGGGR